jgi:hypothetical protein
LAVLREADVDEFICATLRGDYPAWPMALGNTFGNLLIRRAEYHGVTALLNERFPHLSTCPNAVRDAAHRRAVAQALWEMQHKHVLSEVVDALWKKGIEPLLFKGTSLAYGLYENPFWRARGDSDIIVPADAAGHAGEVLRSLGFQQEQAVTGELVTYQESYTFTGQQGGSHTIDLHRRINNSEFLSRLFSYGELRAEAISLPQLCSRALAVEPKHALILACLHRSTHIHNPYWVEGEAYYGGNRLIWLYDIHLLGRSFISSQWQDFVASATDKGLCATSLAGLESAAACFFTPYPDEVRRALSKTGEPVAAYLHATRLRQSWIDLVALNGATERLRFLRELVFPSASYMHSKYSHLDWKWLPLLYMRRATGGFMRRLGRHSN